MREYSEESKEYWDKKWAYGERHRERVALDGSDGEKEFDREIVDRTTGKTVLDEGCGSGVFTLRIARRAKHVTGVDISTAALRHANRNLARTG